MEYTKEETEQFKFDRNQKRKADKEAKRLRGVMVHLSKHSLDYYLKYGLKPKGVTFVGSIREKFTGLRRNNFGQIYSRA
jgi:hypothetical protein